MNDTTSLLRLASQWLIGIALAVVLTALFLAIAAAQVTSGDTGQRILRRAVAATTDIDAILPGIEAGLHKAAQGTTADTVRAPDFPIPVDLTRGEALGLQGDELRARLLDEAARQLYDDGMSVWAQADPEAEQSIETISTTGAFRRGLGIITDDNHTRIVIAAFVLAFLAVALTVVLLSAVRPAYSRLLALGAAVAGAALPSLAAAVAVRFGLRTAEREADPFVEALLKLGVDTMWVPLRNYLALSTLGFAVILLAVFAIWWEARRSASQALPSSDATP